MNRDIFFKNIPVIFTEKAPLTQKTISFLDIPVIFAEKTISKECSGTIGLITKQERKEFLDWYNEEYLSYSEKLRNKEGIDEDEWEDAKWEYDEIGGIIISNIVKKTIITLPPGKIKFKIIVPGSVIYRINRTQNIPSDNNLWFFPENFVPSGRTLYDYGLFNNSYLLKIEVIKPLYVVDMDDLNTILRLMTDKRYRNRQSNNVPFALAMNYAFLGQTEMYRTSTYSYDLSIADVLCETCGFDGFISTTPPQHPEMVVCSEALNKIHVIDSVKGSKIKERWYLESIDKQIASLRERGEEQWNEEIERLKEERERKDFGSFKYLAEAKKESFDELMI